MKCNVRQALRVFYKVTHYGDQHGGEYHLDGITARSEQDGYTIILSDDEVTLTVFFHNTFDVERSSDSALQSFYDRLEKIDQAEYARA